MEFLPEVKILTAAQILNASTAAEWTSNDPILPANMMAYASDTNVLKIGDGVHKWSELAVFYSQGMVDAVQHVSFVADIAARDALTGTKKNGLVVVLDASGDPTVVSTTKKQATYIWETDTLAWVKLAEQESMDLDLTPYFNKNIDTADSIKDGVAKVVMTAAERATVATLKTDAVCYSHTIVLQGVTAAQLKAMEVAAG